MSDLLLVDLLGKLKLDGPSSSSSTVKKSKTKPKKLNHAQRRELERQEEIANCAADSKSSCDTCKQRKFTRINRAMGEQQCHALCNAVRCKRTAMPESRWCASHEQHCRAQLKAYSAFCRPLRKDGEFEFLNKWMDLTGGGSGYNTFYTEYPRRKQELLLELRNQPWYYTDERKAKLDKLHYRIKQCLAGKKSSTAECFIDVKGSFEHEGYTRALEIVERAMRELKAEDEFEF